MFSPTQRKVMQVNIFSVFAIILVAIGAMIYSLTLNITSIISIKPLEVALVSAQESGLIIDVSGKIRNPNSTKTATQVIYVFEVTTDSGQKAGTQEGTVAQIAPGNEATVIGKIVLSQAAENVSFKIKSASWK